MKTQSGAYRACDLACWLSFSKPYCSIPLAFHLDASSSEMLEASFNQIATSTGFGTTKDDVLTWLSLHTGADENWVLLFDNADDVDLDLMPYFPSGSHGNILITTRNADAPGEYASSGDLSSYKVGDLKPDEARTLLRKVVSLSTVPDSDLDDLAEVSCPLLRTVEASNLL